MEHIYIGFADTPGIFALFIRSFLKQRYIHVVISTDMKLDEAFSVGRRNPAIPFSAGFEREDKEKILRKYPKAYYRICSLECTKVQKDQIKKHLYKDYQRRFQIHYAVLGLPFIAMGIPVCLKNQYTCSSYLAELLEEYGILTFHKHFSLVTPKDFLEYPGMKKVFEGNLYEFTESISDYAMKRESAYER